MVHYDWLCWKVMASFSFLFCVHVLKERSISYLWLRLLKWLMRKSLDRFKNRDKEEIMNFSPRCQYPFQKTNTGKNSLSYIDCTIWNENISSTTQIKVIYLWRPQNITNFVTSHPTMTPHLQKRTLYLLFKTIESSLLLILNWKLFKITPVRRVKKRH